ncbi:MAG: 5-formyltetrahydrofolate cyclo-ligase [Proteobacteria bacterium]|nr:5-formyltetrahydrofolate cyclo-ligase [Pseudomonadota bacterium]
MIDAKKKLRDEAKARRALLSPAERQAGAARVAEIGLDFAGVKAPAIVSGFLAIGEEINPAPLMKRLQGQGFGLALPVMLGRGKALEFRSWAPGDPLQTVMWGIREPFATAQTVEPEVLLVPLLAFDRRGYRLGYGGGFYDRSIAGLRARKPILTIGLAFSSQEVDAVPHLDYDEKLDWVLTPEGPIRCLGP